MTRLTSRARTLLWAGSGGFLGLGVGVALMDAGFLLVAALPLVLLYGLFVGGVVLFGRDRPRAAAAPALRAAAPAPRAPQPLEVSVTFPDVPPGYPPVLGIDDPLHVRVTVDARQRHEPGSGHDRRLPAEGAAVRLTGRLRDGARFVAGEGVTGSDGAVTFDVKPRGVGEVILEAEAVLGDLRGVGEASGSLVRYEEEIERLFGEFRAYAHDELGPESKTDTPRELAEKLRGSASAQTAKALLELARVYELVVYGDRTADRTLYLALVGALLQLQQEA